MIAVLAAALILRIVLIFAFKTSIFPIVWEYEEIANNLLVGQGYSIRFLETTYRSFNTPLFGFLCAGVYTVTNHSYFAIFLIQSIFTIALATVIFQTANLVFNLKVGLMAAALVAFHPGFIHYDVFNLLPLSIDSFLIAAITLLFLNCADKPNLTSMSLLGVLIGIATLSRGIIGILLPLVIIYLLLLTPNVTLKRRLLLSVWVCGAAFLILAPWIIRNYMIHKQFVYVSTTGENLWRGNNIHATGTSQDENHVKIIDLWPEDFKERVYSLSEMQQKKFFEEEALHFIRAHPLTAAKLYLEKVYYFWWFSPQSGITYPKKYLTAYKYFYAVLITFFLAGVCFAIASRKRKVLKSSLILISVPLTICLTQSVFYVEGRHRWLIEPIMIIFFSYGVIKCSELLYERFTNVALLSTR